MEEKIIVRPGFFILFIMSAPTILFGYFLVIELIKHQNSILFYTLLFLISLVFPIAHWFKNKIVLEDNIVSIKSLLFLPRSRESWGPIYSFETPADKKFNINNIDNITVITTWAFRAARDNIDEAGSGENIDIHCRGPEETITVELFRFPRFKKIVKEIIRRNPEVKIGFIKRGVMDNLKQLK